MLNSLSKARRVGLYVCLSLWLGYVLHGELTPDGRFDDDAGVASTICRAVVNVMSWVADSIVLDSQARRVDLCCFVWSGHC